MTWSYARDLERIRKNWTRGDSHIHDYVQELNTKIGVCKDSFKAHHGEFPKEPEEAWLTYFMHARFAYKLPDSISTYKDQVYDRMQLKRHYPQHYQFAAVGLSTKET